MFIFSMWVSLSDQEEIPSIPVIYKNKNENAFLVPFLYIEEW